MIFTPTGLAGAFVIHLEPHQDERGFFARSVCQDEYAEHGLNARFVQQSLSWNPYAGTLRGMHFQAPPHEEEKLVRVTRGAVFDVIVDMRRDHDSFGRWFGVELSAENRCQLYIPKGFAHGFQTLTPDTEVFYQMTVPFDPASVRGLRWDDPELEIAWPGHASRRISDRDRALPLLKELQ